MLDPWEEWEVRNNDAVLEYRGDKELLQVVWIGIIKTNQWGDHYVFGASGLGALCRERKEAGQDHGDHGGDKTSFHS